MEAHFSTRHMGVAMNAELRAVMALKPHERELTMQLISNQKAKKPKCNDPTCVCSFK